MDGRKAYQEGVDAQEYKSVAQLEGHVAIVIGIRTNSNQQ